MNTPEEANVGKLAPVWLKAAVLGSLWASSEIILGSFLHNLHVPLRSMVLAAIGVSLMVAAGRNWSDRGLYWRSGLICALLKSTSPSGVILAPMVAICAQGFLMELSVRTGGRNLLAWLAGGMLAVSWNLAQMILYYLLLYGWDAVGIYHKLYDLVAEAFPLPEGRYLLPVYAALFLHTGFGLAGAFTGYFLAASRKKMDIQQQSVPSEKVLRFMKEQKRVSPQYLPFLFLNALLLLGFLVLIPWLRFPLDLIMPWPLLIFWWIRYRSSMRLLRKPGFWLGFFIVSLLAAFLIDQARNEFTEFSFNGLKLGLAINMRALVIITGLMATGVELANPLIRQRMKKSWLRNLFLSMEAASRILPEMIAQLPPPRFLLFHPLKAFAMQVRKVDHWLTILWVRNQPKPFLVMISGAVHSGKTSLLKDILSRLKDRNIKCGGLISMSVFEGKSRAGYDLHDCMSDERWSFSRISGKGKLQIGNYKVEAAALERAYQSLRRALDSDAEILVLDEVGPWELTGNGFAGMLPAMLMKRDKVLIWVVREAVLEPLIRQWGLESAIIFRTDQGSSSDVVARIEEILRSGKNPHQAAVL